MVVIVSLTVVLVLLITAVVVFYKFTDTGRLISLKSKIAAQRAVNDRIDLLHNNPKPKQGNILND